jgi:hypothetical protein
LFNQPKDYCVFSIDGLEDTNQIYRRNVNWAKLISNATAFIAAGGSAHWDMLVFKHNQHQVEACEQLARDMGFKWFRAKVSKRPLVSRLEWPRNYQAQSFDGAIKCHAQQEKSAYIDACGRLSPCCWLGSSQTTFVNDIKEVSVTWKTDNPHSTCQSTCSSNKNKTTFTDQWQRETQLC